MPFVFTHFPDSKLIISQRLSKRIFREMQIKTQSGYKEKVGNKCKGEKRARGRSKRPSPCGIWNLIITDSGV